MNRDSKNSQKNNNKDGRDFTNLLNNIPNETISEKISEILKSTDDNTRIKILYLPKDRELCSRNIESASKSHEQLYLIILIF